MNDLLIVVGASWLAGIAASVGGLFAFFGGDSHTTVHRELIHGIIAFGGGILVAAVAFALIPEGIEFLPTSLLATTVCLGGLVFCLLDTKLSVHGGSKAQFMAMLIDFVPEAIALGAVFGHDHHLGILLAIFIGTQNLPEGFNAYRESVTAGISPRATLTALFSISLLGPISAYLGYSFLQNHEALTAGMMSFAGGGILYLVFQDIAPQSTMRRHWTPPLGAVLGFVVGMVGKQLLN